jgi:hypothetical protein
MNLKTARMLYSAIAYADEQVMSSDIAVYLDHGVETDEDFELNRKLNAQMISFACDLLNQFADHIKVTVVPGCISMNREEQYVREAVLHYMCGMLSSKIEVVHEDDDSAELIYHR